MGVVCVHIMSQLFSALEDQGIKYVHFKSNLSLNMSFAGKGDFDVLVDRGRLADVEAALISLHAKRFNKVRYGVYPGVDNWLLFDEETGLLHHLHLHYQLVSGKPYLKEYVIPWDSLLFETRTRDPEYGLYIASPQAELLLLTVRSVIKSRLSDLVKALLGGYRLHKSLAAEREDLLDKVSGDELLACARRLFTRVDAQRLVRVALAPVWRGGQFLTASRLVRRELREYRRYSAPGATLRSAALRVGDIWNKVLRRKLGRCRVEKKITPSGGKIIAFVGVDGAGKSTVVDAVSKWMDQQIESRRFYMGTGDGKTNIFARLAKKVYGSVPRHGGNAPAGGGAPVTLRDRPLLYIRKICAALMVYSVERDNHRKLIRMNRYRLMGGVSLLDRYPQIETEGQNDGPKISVYQKAVAGSRFLVWLRRREMAQLDIVRRVKPDMVIRLNISAEASMSRKPGQVDIGSFRRKIDELRQVTFQNAPIIDVSAEQPYEDEILQIKKIIWESF